MHTQTALLRIAILGPPLVEYNAQPWSPSSLKAQALLYYLAAVGKPAGRDHLTALLWGDAELHDARHSLRSALYKLRRSLEAIGAAEILISDGDRLALDHERIQSDLADFQRLLAGGSEADLRAAVGLIRGAFLQDFSLPDALIFDEFVHQQDAWLTRSLQQALGRLAACAEQREDWDQAARDLQALSRLDPLDEQTHQRLIQLYVRSGAPRLAQRQYQLLERTLQHELGIAPSERSQAMMRSSLARERSRAALPAAPAPFVRTHPAMLPFVGRAGPLDLLRRSAETVRTSGVGQALLIEGEAGIGKSRLVDMFVGSLAGEDAAQWRIVQGRCSPFDTILPYGAFREAFDRMVPAGGSGDLPAEHFAEHVLQTLRDLSRAGPLLLAIDDLHLADPLSLRLFGYLALHLRSLPLVLIGTMHALNAPLELRELAGLGRRRGDLQTIRLAALDSAEIGGVLAELAISTSAGAVLVPWLRERSAGNPFVLEALLSQLELEGLLVQHPSGRQLDTLRWFSWRAANHLPSSTHDLVSFRLPQLTPPARRIADLLALAAGPVPIAVLIAAAGQDQMDVSDAIDSLLAQGIAIESADQLAPAHALLREAILAQLSGPSRRAGHCRLAIAWEQQLPHDSLVVAQIARHAVAGADLERARRYGLALLNDLPYTYAGAETIAFLQQLADLVAPQASAAEQYRLAQALGQAHRALGQIEQAQAWHGRQLHAAEQSGLLEAEVHAHYELAELALLRNDYAAVIAAARRGMQRASAAAPAVRAGLLGRGHRLIGGATAMEGSDLAAAEADLRAAIDAHRQADDRINLSVDLFELGNVLAQQGDIRRALSLYEEAAASLGAGRSPFLEALIGNNLAYHSLVLGQPEAARRTLTAARAIAERYGLSAALLHLFSTESELHFYSGDLLAAEATCRHGLALAEYLGNHERQAAYQAGLGLVAARQGRIDEGRRMLETALAQIADQAFWHLRTRMLLWLAEILLDHDPEAVDTYLETGLTLARTQRRRLLQFQAERLQALHLARRDPAAAQRALVELLDQAAALDLNLEAALTRAALARVTLRHAPDSASGRALVSTALRELAALGAQTLWAVPQ